MEVILKVTFEWLYGGVSVISLPLLIYIAFKTGKIVQNVCDLNVRITKLENKVYHGDK